MKRRDIEMASFRDMFDNVKDKISSRGSSDNTYDFDELDEFDEFDVANENDAVKPLSATVEEERQSRRSASRSRSGFDSLFSSTDNSAEKTAEIDLIVDDREQSDSRVSLGRASTLSGPSNSPQRPQRGVSVESSSRRPRQVAVIKPDNYEEARDLIEVLKAGDAVILDMREVDSALANRFMDFSFGATAALSGKVDVIMNRVYGVSVGQALTKTEIDKAKAEGLI